MILMKRIDNRTSSRWMRVKCRFAIVEIVSGLGQIIDTRWHSFESKTNLDTFCMWNNVLLLHWRI